MILSVAQIVAIRKLTEAECHACRLAVERLRLHGLLPSRDTEALDNALYRRAHNLDVV